MPRNSHFDDEDPRDAAARGDREDDDNDDVRDDEEEMNLDDADRGDAVAEEEEEAEEEELVDTETLRAAAAEAAEDEEMVPRARLNEVLERERQLVDKVLERGAPAARQQEEQRPPPFDLKAKRKEHTRLLMEGKEDEADELAEAIDAHLIAVAQANAVEQMRQERLADEVAAASSQVTRLFPVLDPKNKAFDEEAVDMVVARRDRLIRSGMPAGEAIIKASKSVCKRLGIEAVDEDDDAPRRRTPAREEGDDGKQVRGRDGKVTPIIPKRTPEQIRRAADIAKRIPPRTGAEGLGQRAARRDEEIDPSDMTEAQLEALEKSDPAAFKRLRGDDVPATQRRR
ncbi:MAG: hypothetical protein JSS23_00100 [Proteobacteria bacterium]|nr:hypothetical protein [Pseudomonadota bacterium]